MSLETAVYDILAAVSPGVKAYADTFEQPDGSLPAWPAIRYALVSSESADDICGSGTEDTDDVRIQVDVVAKTSAERVTLRAQVRAAMQAGAIPVLFAGVRNEYDYETKTFRSSQDFILYQSTPP